jgi:pyrroline-5-carboxylate reductase
MLNKKIGLIGAGNMGEAIAGALIRAKVLEPLRLHASDISMERLHRLNRSYGISTTEDNLKLFAQCDVVILAVKPQQMEQVLSQIATQENYKVTSRKLVISIAAGIRLHSIENILYTPLDNISREKLPIIRVMPNTPALVSAGISGMSPNRHAKAEDINITRTILEIMGRVIEFKEDDMDAVTALSGSGPAYVFYLVESMIEGGMNAGLNPNDAEALTLATLKGSLALMEEQNESPEALRRKVTSPGGTTEAALKVLKDNKVKQHIIEAIAAAAKRSKELSR